MELNASSLPDQPGANQNLAWLDALDPSLADAAFEQCKVNASFAQHDFAENKLRFGAVAALADFDRRVLRWAQEFTNPRLSRVMYVLGKAMDGTTHERAVSINGKHGDSPKIAKGKLLDLYRSAYASQGHTISYRQFRRYLVMADGLGLIERRRQPGRQGESGWRPGARLPTVTRVNFWRVLKDGEIAPHDFFARLEAPAETPESPAAAENDPGCVPGSVPGDDPHSLDSSDNSCSSLGRAQAPKKTEQTFSKKKSRPPASGAIELCGRSGCKEPAAWKLAEHLRCDTHKLPMMKRLHQVPERDVRPVDEPAPENDYWVYGDGRFYKKSRHDPDGNRHQVELVHLTKAEAIYLWQKLKPYGQAPNSYQRNFMAHKAFGTELPPGQPRPPADGSRHWKENALRDGEFGL